MTATFLVVATRPAFAASCGSGYNKQIGTEYVSNAAFKAEGVYASTVTRGGYTLCTPTGQGDLDTSSVWVMVYGDTGNLAYAQAGIIRRWADSCPRYYTEDNSNAFNNATMMRSIDMSACAPQNGTVAGFQVRSAFNGTSWQFEESAPAYTRYSQWNPFATLTGTWRADWNGEVKYDASHVPGSSNARYAFNSMMLQDYADDNFKSTCGKMLSSITQLSSGARAVNSCDSTSIWDTRN